jgi:hypothetical protein
VDHWPELNTVDKNLIKIACQLLERFRDKIPVKEKLVRPDEPVQASAHRGW